MGSPETPRDGERVQVDAFVRAASGGHELVFRTRDLSRSGLFLYTKVAHSYPFRPGSRLHIELFDYDQSIALDVVVARVVEPGSPEADSFPTGFGVRILDTDAPTQARLEALIERIRAGGGPY
ncbi:MAG: PilZ domain-containing protein [Kofleriaceae bacterium]|nr:PilZ domain-containing protein [Kofleriaceae bacterium]MCL4226018.1 PilZ domain-containing protein [Myxococcales bacterium]